MARAKVAGASVELTFPDVKIASVVCESIRPEKILPGSTSCEVKVNRRKNVLCLEIDARDTAALRAALNSFLRWAAVARDMAEVGSD
jgi:tRNA threonylcarbamoyladenosine modification (KEOPS) complex  Pcc1 subunit